MAIVKSLRIYRSVMGMTFKNLFKFPSLFKAFLCLALLETLGLVIVYYSPQWPVNQVLAQPIRAFFGEPALHYPYNLMALPRIFRVWQIFVDIFFGSILTGIVVSMYNQHSKKMSLRFGKNFKIAFNRYLPLLAYSMIVFIVIYLVEHFSGIFIRDRLIAGKGYFLKLGQIKWGIIIAVFNLLFSMAIEILWIYVPIAIIIDNKGLWRAAATSLKLVFHYFITTVLLVLIPVTVYLSVVIFRVFDSKLMDLYFPEISVLLILLSIISAFIVNTVITIAGTVMYQSVKENQGI